MAVEGPDILMVKDIPNLLKSLLLRYDFILSTITGILLLATVYYWLLLKISNLTTVFANIREEPIYLGSLVILLPLTFILFGLNFALGVFSMQAKLGVKKQGGTLLGALIGAFGASCPVCGAFLFSLIGITAGLSVLPFGGLELWFASSLIMTITFWYSLKNLSNRCASVDAKGQSCWIFPGVNKRLTVLFATIAIFLVINLYNLAVKHDNLFFKRALVYGYGQCTLIFQ